RRRRPRVSARRHPSTLPAQLLAYGPGCQGACRAETVDRYCKGCPARIPGLPLDLEVGVDNSVDATRGESDAADRSSAQAPEVGYVMRRTRSKKGWPVRFTTLALVLAGALVFFLPSALAVHEFAFQLDGDIAAATSG